jgi:hypothetical protein
MFSQKRIKLGTDIKKKKREICNELGISYLKVKSWSFNEKNHLGHTNKDTSTRVPKPRSYQHIFKFYQPHSHFPSGLLLWGPEGNS